MERENFVTYISQKLAFLRLLIVQNGKLNLLNTNVISENFYRDLLNLLYEFNLENLNKSISNEKAVDLADTTNKIIVQVTSDSSKKKIENTILKLNTEKYDGFNLKIVFIGNPNHSLRNVQFSIPSNFSFTPAIDILDVDSILKDIINLSTPRLEQIYEFIKNEIKYSDPTINLDSKLTQVINILVNENLDSNNDINIQDFDIDKKIIFNNLNGVNTIINEYVKYNGKLSKIYSTFDSSGKNASFAVLQAIRKEYTSNKNNFKDNSLGLFMEIVKNIKQTVLESKNLNEMSTEELDLCIDIIIVDAFIRCKIFENPEGYRYVDTR